MTRRYVVEFEPVGDDSVPDVVRLRRLLKALLRAFRFRVTRVARVRQEEPR